MRERIDTDQVNGIGGAMSDSTITGLHIRHTKVGLWFDGPMDNVKVSKNVIVDQIADALNFHIGVTNSLVSHNFIRNTGDDALAMWAQTTANADNTFDQHDPDADARQRHRHLRRDGQHGLQQPGGRPAARGQACTPVRGSGWWPSPETSTSPTTPWSGRRRSS